MQIDVIDSLTGLLEFRTEWLELYGRCPRATPFQSPQWLIPWTRHLFGGGQIYALAMREEQDAIGFAPLFLWGIERRFVSFLGAGISDYGDLLFAPGRERECVDAIWQFLSRRQGQWDALDLQEVRSDSVLLDGRPCEQCSVCPVLDLRTWPDSMDRKHRTDLRRTQNKLRNNSELQFCTSGIDEFLPLYEARWGTMDAPLRRFHLEAGGDFYLLRINGAPAAAIYMLTGGRTAYCYLSGYEPTLAKLSPGAVLLNWIIEQAAGRGFKEVDFLRKPEAYKYLWGARDRLTYKV